MDERFKNLAIVILGVLCLLFLIGTVSSCSNAYRQKFAKDKEMASRLDLEEKLSKLTHDKVAVEEKLKAKDKEILEASVGLAGAKKSLIEEQMINQSLKEELTKVSKVKEALEQELKDYKAGVKSKIKR
jgi:septum formation inhibitor MinC